MFISSQGQYCCAGDARGSCSSFGLHHLARHNNTNIGEKLKLMKTRALRSKFQVLLTLTIWYQWTLTSMLRESTEDLKAQVLH